MDIIVFIYEKMENDKSFLNKTAFKMSLGEILHNIFTHSGALDSGHVQFSNYVSPKFEKKKLSTQIDSRFDKRTMPFP